MPLPESEQQPEQQPGPPAKKASLAGPLTGLAISVCCYVVFFLVGIVSYCGAGTGGGFNNPSPGPGSPLSNFAFLTVGASILSFFGCFVWLIVELVRRSRYK